ncbi:MAG: hypothetical protein GF409_02605 [Candidatus Omnitrophica bacterium]|nr:hypothetical protein [Candidatus Omnitrophota bacterium]
MGIADILNDLFRRFKEQNFLDRVYQVIVLVWIITCSAWAISHFLYYLNLCRASYEIYVSGSATVTMLLIGIETLIAWVFLVVIPVKLVPVIWFVCLKLGEYLRART